MRARKGVGFDPLASLNNIAVDTVDHIRDRDRCMVTRKTKSAEMVLCAYGRGFRVLDDGSLIGIRGKVLSPGKDQNGYYDASIRCDGRRGKVAVHQLAGYQKFGEAALAEGIEVRHLDGNPSNNSKPNIAIGTHSDNENDKTLAMKHASSMAGARKLRSLTEDQVRELRADHAGGMKYLALMSKYDLAKSTVSYIVTRRTYPDVW